MKLLALLLLAAVPKGGKLYVKEPGATLTAKADGKGAKTELKAGDAVVWQGADAKQPAQQLVEHQGKKGYLPQGALTPNRPSEELGADGKPMTPAPVKLKTSSGDDSVAAALHALEEGSQAAKQKVPEHVKKAGLR